MRTLSSASNTTKVRSTWCCSRAAATTSPQCSAAALVDRQIFVLDVAGGDKVPRKGGPGVSTADLLVINKTDLAPFVGADLGVMTRDAAIVREGRPTLLCSLREDSQATDVANWVRAQLP